MEVKAENLSFNNSSSGSSSTTAQEALDELYDKVDPAINFTINHTDQNGNILETYRYVCNPGTTWGQFISSSYNDGRFTTDKFGSDLWVNFNYSSNNYAYVRTVLTDDSTIQLSSQTIVERAYLVNEYWCCFEPDTLITIDYDGNTKKIKDIEVGDRIVVVNTKTGKKTMTTVVKDASEHPITYNMTDVVLENGTILTFNSYHPIYTTEGYKSVTNYNNYPTIEEGDYTVDINNKKIKITKIKEYRTKPHMTYNLLIKGINDDFLEEEYAYIANGVLVHTGIAEYDDEDEWRNNRRPSCTHQELYKNFNYDKASDIEIVEFLVELYFKDEEAEKEYIKYYLTANQYFRYTEFAKEVKMRIKNINPTRLNKFSKYNKKTIIN